MGVEAEASAHRRPFVRPYSTLEMPAHRSTSAGVTVLRHTHDVASDSSRAGRATGESWQGAATTPLPSRSLLQFVGARHAARSEPERRRHVAGARPAPSQPTEKPPTMSRTYCIPDIGCVRTARISRHRWSSGANPHAMPHELARRVLAHEELGELASGKRLGLLGHHVSG